MLEKAPDRTQSSAFGFPPGVFLIGAQKAATTRFADLLSQHPAVTLSTPKEPNYFTNYWEQGVGWYATRFASRDGVLLDASTTYSQCPFLERCDANNPLVGVPERIRSLRADARLIYMIRDPVARAYSAYWHNIRRGWERLPLREAIAPRSNYVAASSYGYQLDRYLEVFPPDQVLVVRMETFIAREREILARCLEFLGLTDADFRFHAFRARNRSFTYNRLGRTVRRLVGGEARLKRLNLTVRDRLPNYLRERAAALLTASVPPLDEDTRSFIAERIDPDLATIRPRHGLSILG